MAPSCEFRKQKSAAMWPKTRQEDFEPASAIFPSALGVGATSGIPPRSPLLAPKTAKARRPEGNSTVQKSRWKTFAIQKPTTSARGGSEKSRNVVGATQSPGQSRSWQSTGGKRQQSRRFHQIGPRATPIQRLRANFQLWRDESRATSPAQSLAVEMAADVDMENMPPRHDFRSLRGVDLDLMTMEEFEKANPYTPPLPRRIAEPLRAQTKHGEYSTAFQLACDARGILREFTFYTVAQQCFEVELKLDGNVVDRIGQYASHRDAKEEMCRKHLAIVEAMPKRKKREVSDAHIETPSGLEDEAWISLIYEYIQKQHLPFPDFEFQSADANHGTWTCMLRVKGFSLTTFGGIDKKYATKTIAKKAAAMEAVQWLRSQSVMEPAPEKRRDPGPERPSEQVHQLALELGFTQPSYKHVPEPTSNSFYNTHAMFAPADSRKDPRLEGQVGLVLRIFGKKAAQQACAVEVLKVLEAIRRSRLMP